MPVDHKEKAFESAIEHHLITAAGYTKADQGFFDQVRALDATQFVPFVKDTQPDTWKKLEKLLGSRTEETLLDDLCKAMDSRGSLDVIRHGFKCYGEPVKVAYFAPAHGMNPEVAGALREEPADGRPPASVQAHQHQGARPDHLPERHPDHHRRTQEPHDGAERERCGLAVPVRPRSERPDLPVQEAHAGALRRRSRPGVHDDEARGQEHVFPALQPGRRHGRGKPASTRGQVQNAYLWEQVWQRDSLLDILARFIHLEVDRGGRRRARRSRRRP